MSNAPSTAASTDAIGASTHRFTVEQVRRACVVIDGSGVVEELARWKAAERRGPQGRHEIFPTRALLVAMLLAARTDQPMLLTVFCEVLFRQIDAAGRAELDVPSPPGRLDRRGWNAAYRNVRTRFESMLALMNPSPNPQGRRLTEDQLQAAIAKAASCGMDLTERFDRLQWFVNRIIETSFRLLPREVRRRWKGTVGLDATVVPSFSRQPSQAHGARWGSGSPVRLHSSDPDCGWYKRTPDDRDDEPEVPGGGKRSAISKLIWGYEATWAVACADPDRGEEFPTLIIGMAPLHKPGAEVGQNAVSAIASIVERGHPTAYLVVDRAYPNSKPDHLQLPARALGYDLVFDYRKDWLGVQDSVDGFLQIEGAWYCTSIPDELTWATRDFLVNKTIDERTFQERIAERAKYRARPKEAPDADGCVRMGCPAAGPAPIAACPLKPRSVQRRNPHMVRIPLRVEVKKNPPKCCNQESVKIPPEKGARFAQTLQFRSEMWKRIYSTVRNSTEGMWGYMKDPAHEALEAAGRRRVGGVAAQSVFVAFLAYAANARKIDSFMAGIEGLQVHAKRRRRQRDYLPIQHWRPDTVDRPPDPTDAA